MSEIGVCRVETVKCSAGSYATHSTAQHFRHEITICQKNVNILILILILIVIAIVILILRMMRM